MIEALHSTDAPVIFESEVRKLYRCDAPSEITSKVSLVGTACTSFVQTLKGPLDVLMGVRNFDYDVHDLRAICAGASGPQRKDAVAPRDGVG